jgi:hypothetical protein
VAHQGQNINSRFLAFRLPGLRIIFFPRHETHPIASMIEYSSRVGLFLCLLHFAHPIPQIKADGDVCPAYPFVPPSSSFTAKEVKLNGWKEQGLICVMGAADEARKLRFAFIALIMRLTAAADPERPKRCMYRLKRGTSTDVVASVYKRLYRHCKVRPIARTVFQGPARRAETLLAWPVANGVRSKR